MRTWADVVPYLGDLGAADSSLHLSDAQIAAALAVENTALGAAMVLSARHGKIVAAHDVRSRIQASPSLQHIQQLAEHMRMQDAVANYRRRIGERARERQGLLTEWRRLHDERVHLCELRRAATPLGVGPRPEPGHRASAGRSWERHDAAIMVVAALVRRPKQVVRVPWLRLSAAERRNGYAAEPQLLLLGANRKCCSRCETYRF
jgi:hypothetical protein